MESMNLTVLLQPWWFESRRISKARAARHGAPTAARD
jgi:hypothetical protein